MCDGEEAGKGVKVVEEKGSSPAAHLTRRQLRQLGEGCGVVRQTTQC